MSLCAKLVVQPAPRSIEFSNDPVTRTLPLPSHATPLPACTASALPKRRDQRWPPVGESLARKMSTPALVRTPPPKLTWPENAPVTAMFSGPVPRSIVPLNLPVTSTLPLPSIATARPVPPPSAPPRHFDHIVAPVGECFDTNTAAGGHTTPPPKFTLLSTRPVITAL